MICTCTDSNGDMVTVGSGTMCAWQQWINNLKSTTL